MTDATRKTSRDVEEREMVKTDRMPKSLAVTMLVGILTGGAFWGSLALMVVR